MRKRKMLIALCIIIFVVVVIVIWFLIPYSPLRSEFLETVREKKRENVRYENEDVFTSSDFDRFPTAIRNYIERCGYLGTKKHNLVKMEYHDVDFMQGKDGPKLTIDYTQYDFAKQPDRLALIESSMFGVPFQGYDYYLDGKGGMKGVIAKAFTLFHQTGNEMDQACLATYLAECLFIPSALLENDIDMEVIDDFHIKATISFQGQTVSGIFAFNEQYEMTSFTTNDRAVVDTDGTVTYVPWTAECIDYTLGEDGLRHPTKFRAVWNYPDGDFVYFNGLISQILYE